MKGRKRSPVELENYRKLVSMMAWRAYVKLPIQTRMWIGIEDLIQHGMQYAFEVSFKFDRNRAAFSTYLYHQLHRLYINEYIELYSAEQRGWVKVDGVRRPIPHISMQAMQARLQSQERGAELDDVVGQIPALVTSQDHIYQNALTECFVVPALGAVYELSSPKLKSEFVNWFWYKRERICTKGKPFRKLAGEFRELCHVQGISCSDCVHIVRSPKCLDSLSRQLFDIPYDMENPTPAVQRML